jgi:hypothetical protein
VAVTIYVAENINSKRVANPKELTVFLDDDSAAYWFLFRYFEGVNIGRRTELVDLCGVTEIEGYQLDRFEDEMLSARDDINNKPEQWKVLIGWNDSPARENEIWHVAEKSSVAQTIDNLLSLVAIARSKNLKLIASGD